MKGEIEKYQTIYSMGKMSSKRLLAGWPSVFLDAIRFLAAIAVLITHTRAIWYPESELETMPSNLAHGAVVIFFVLSGFVIAHTTSNSNRGLREYAVARLSRLYSVFLPAILITGLCAITVWQFSPVIYNKYNQSNVFFRYIISTCFCNEIWFFSSAPLINGPIWSLSYEFWYYVIFGAFFYKLPGIKGWIIPVLMCLIAGPKILMLMIMWILGWIAYHMKKPLVSNIVAWIIMICLLIIAVLMMAYMPSLPNNINTTKLHWADKFFSDVVVSIIVAAAFYLLPNGIGKKNSSKAVSRFRKLADLTFPIYVLHFPLLVLSESILINLGLDKKLLFLSSLLFAFFCCSIIGSLLERNRKHWSTLFEKIFIKK